RTRPLRRRQAHRRRRPVTGTITLYKGSHTAQQCADGERCLFEWYNWLTRRQNTESCPPGVSPVLHVMGMQLNDCLPDGKRQQLAVLLPNGTSPLAGTAGDGLDEMRSYMALDWLIRVHTPAWLRLAGLDAEAAALRDFRCIDGTEAAEAVRPHALAARDK